MNPFDIAGAHSLQSLIDERAEQSPNAPFFTSPESGQRINYAELRRALRKVGAWLSTTTPGETIGGMVGNGWAAVQLLLGIPYHRRRILLLNPAAGRTGLLHAIRHSECRLIFADSESLPQLQTLAKEEGIEVSFQQIDRDKGLTGDEQNPTPLSPADDALLIYTSGTTGVPKGVLHTHASLLYGGAVTATAHQIDTDDTALCVLPLCHINAQCVTIMAPLVSGGSVVVPHRFSVNRFWPLLAESNCSWFSVVPTIVSRLLHNEKQPPPLPHLRFGRSASSALAPETHRQFEKRFGIPLIETMGLSETAATILSNPMPPANRKVGSSGIAFGCQVRVINSEGDEMPRNETGEIAVRGGNVMRGYLKAEQETAAAFTADGWLLTGDLGHMDEDGFIFVTGRRKELIIKGGENIAPREIDDALYQVEGVIEAACFPRPCKIYGQRVEAAVVVASGNATDEGALIAHCIHVLGEFKAPERIYFLPELPKGPSGKIQRLKLTDSTASATA